MKFRIWMVMNWKVRAMRKVLRRRMKIIVKWVVLNLGLGRERKEIQVPRGLNGGKRLKKSAAMGESSEEFGGKKVKRKSGVGKLKGEANKVVVVKDKKTKNLGLEWGKEVDEEGVEEEIKDDGEVGSFEFGVWKRKEGDSIDNLVPGDSNDGQRSKKSAAMGEKSEGSGGKKVKRKSGAGKLKDGQRRL